MPNCGTARSAPQTRNTAQAKRRAVRNRRPRSGWSPEDTERSEVRRGGTQPAEGEGCAKARNTAQALAQGCAKTRNDHAELRVGAKSEAAKRLKWRAHGAKRSAQSKARRAEASRGARRPPPVAETGRSKPNEAGSATSELASAVERPCRIVEQREALRRRGTPRKRSVERCEDAEHRTAKGECGAKRRKGG